MTQDLLDNRSVSMSIGRSMVYLQASGIALPSARNQLTTREERMRCCTISTALACPPLRVRLLHGDPLEGVAVVVCASLSATVLIARLYEST